VLRAAAPALVESLSTEHAAATQAGFLQRLEGLPEPMAPAADASAALTLAAVLAALLR